MRLKLGRAEVDGWSQQGRLRPANGDAWSVEMAPEPQRQRHLGALLAVAEGYAGDGSELPWLGTQVLEQLGRGYFGAARGDCASALLAAVQGVNRQLYDWRMGWGRPVFAGLVAAAATPRDAVVTQVGDGQAFLLRGPSVYPLFPWTTLPAAGGERGRRPWDTAIGWQPRIPARVNHVGLQPGDALLLCSGGFTASLPAWPTWAKLPSPADMIRVADDGSGRFNRTVVLLRLPESISAASPARALPADRHRARSWQPVVEVLGPVALAALLATVLLAATQ